MAELTVVCHKPNLAITIECTENDLNYVVGKVESALGIKVRTERRTTTRPQTQEEAEAIDKRISAWDQRRPPWPEPDEL